MDVLILPFDTVSLLTVPVALAGEVSGIGNNVVQPNVPAIPSATHPPPSAMSNALEQDAPARRQRIQWNNFRGPLATLTQHLIYYQGMTTGKVNWVNNLANKLVCNEAFMAPLKEKGHTVGDVHKVST